TGPAGPEGDRWAVGAALWGMLPVIRAEHPELKPRIIDLDPHAEIDPDALVAFLRSEIDEDRIVVREGHALAPRLVRGMAESESEAAPATLGGANYRLVPERRGTLEASRYVLVERADPGPDEVEVRIRTTGLNFRDVLNVLGMYPGDPGPPGVEFAGVVTRVGPGVDRFAPGDEVIGIDTALFAAYATIPAAAVVPMPRGLTHAEAATI